MAGESEPLAEILILLLANLSVRQKRRRRPLHGPTQAWRRIRGGTEQEHGRSGIRPHVLDLGNEGDCRQPVTIRCYRPLHNIHRIVIDAYTCIGF